MVMNKKLLIIGLLFLLLGIVLCINKIYFGIIFAICSYFIVYFSFPNTKVTKIKVIEENSVIEKENNKQRGIKKTTEVKRNVAKTSTKKVNKVSTIEKEEKIENKDKSQINNNKVVNDSTKHSINDIIVSLEDNNSKPVPDTTISTVLNSDTVNVDVDVMDNLVLSLEDALDKSREQYEKYVQVRFLGYSKIYTYISNPLKKLKTGDYVTIIGSNNEEKIVQVVEGDRILPKKYDMEYKMIQFPMYQFENYDYNLNYNYKNMVK